MALSDLYNTPIYGMSGDLQGGSFDPNKPLSMMSGPTDWGSGAPISNMSGPTQWGNASSDGSQTGIYNPGANPFGSVGFNQDGKEFQARGDGNYLVTHGEGGSVDPYYGNPAAYSQSVNVGGKDYWRTGMPWADFIGSAKTGGAQSASPYTQDGQYGQIDNHPEYGHLVPTGIAGSILGELAQSQKQKAGGDIFNGPLLWGAPLAFAGPISGALGAGGAFGGYASAAAADAAGLAQMGAAAGLQGSALEAFVASGGTLGSTAAGGGGIGAGAGGGWLNSTGWGNPESWNSLAPEQGTTGASGGGASGGAGSVPPSQPSFLDQLKQFFSPNPVSAATTAASAMGGGGGGLSGSGDVLNDFGSEIGGGSGGLQGAGAAALGGAAGGAASNALGRLLSGQASPSDYASLLGSLGAAGLGALGANSQTSALTGVADKYLQLGAPFRGALLNSYSPGFDLAKSDPAFQGALDQASQGVLRGLSTHGNPYDSPGALIEANKQIANSVTLPQLNTYRSQLGTFGQLGTNTAGAADTGAANLAGNAFTGLGGALGTLTAPTNDLTSLLRQLQGFKTNTGSFV